MEGFRWEIIVVPLIVAGCSLAFYLNGRIDGYKAARKPFIYKALGKIIKIKSLRSDGTGLSYEVPLCPCPFCGADSAPALGEAPNQEALPVNERLFGCHTCEVWLPQNQWNRRTYDYK